MSIVVNFKKKYNFWQFFREIDIQKAKKVGRCRQVGSDKGRPKGRVGSGSGNEQVGPILTIDLADTLTQPPGTYLEPITGNGNALESLYRL